MNTFDIEAVIDERIRPSLNFHGGDIKIVSLENGVLKVRFTGNCSTCPSARITLEEIVKEEIAAAFPEIKDVILSSGASDELISEAREILRKRHEKS